MLRTHECDPYVAAAHLGVLQLPALRRLGLRGSTDWQQPADRRTAHHGTPVFQLPATVHTLGISHSHTLLMPRLAGEGVTQLRLNRCRLPPPEHLREGFPRLCVLTASYNTASHQLGNGADPTTFLTYLREGVAAGWGASAFVDRVGALADRLEELDLLRMLLSASARRTALVWRLLKQLPRLRRLTLRVAIVPEAAFDTAGGAKTEADVVGTGCGSGSGSGADLHTLRVFASYVRPEDIATSSGIGLLDRLFAPPATSDTRPPLLPSLCHLQLSNLREECDLTALVASPVWKTSLAHVALTNCPHLFSAAPHHSAQLDGASLPQH